MPVKRYVICDECGHVKAPYSEISQWQQKVSFEEVMESGEGIVEISGWVVKAFPDPEDPIVVDAKFFCGNCAKGVGN